ncbi:MAG: metallophosphoesterase family protein [Candidatus Kariarchaeaceae archaeon]
MSSLVKLRKTNHVILILLILLSCGLNLNSTLAYGEKKILETNFLSLSSTLNDSISFNESLQFSFDPVNHEIRYITWPHSAYPALVIQNNSFTLQLNDSLANIYLGLINRELNYSFTLNPLDSSLSTSFEFNITQDIPAELYDILLYNEADDIIDSQTHSIKIFDKELDQPRFVHVTDTHLPLYSSQNTIEAVIPVFQNIELVEPDFVLLTGDFLEGALTYQVNETTGVAPLYSFETLIMMGLDFLDNFNLPIFVIPGNHDWMTIYPERDSSRPTWEKYFGTNFVQSFHFGAINFIGYGSGPEGISDSEFNELKETIIERSGMRILYTHYDFDNRIENNLDVLGLNIMFYGHDHNSKITQDGQTLFVMTHNSFQPDSEEPSNGFRIVTILNETTIQIDNSTYIWPLYEEPAGTYPTDPSHDEETVFSSFVFSVTSIGILSISFKRRKEQRIKR